MSIFLYVMFLVVTRKEKKPDMNSQFIQGIQFDWNNLDEDSYVRDIQAFQGLETLKFSQPVTFFAGENGSGKIKQNTGTPQKMD